MITKWKELDHIENQADIVIGWETDLNPRIHDFEFLMVNYSSFPRDRKDGWKGVIVIVKK